MREDMIRTKIKEIQESIKLVEENLPGEVEEFVALGLLKDGIYKRVEHAIENVIDICAVINTDLELGIPSSEDDIIENLARNKILSGEMGGRVRGMRGFRNFLVHRYGRMDDKVAFENIGKGMGDFSKFIKEIERFLKRRTPHERT